MLAVGRTFADRFIAHHRPDTRLGELVRRFQIEIADHAYEVLAALAREERRPLQAQAGWLLECCLNRQARKVRAPIVITPRGRLVRADDVEDLTRARSSSDAASAGRDHA